MSIRDGNQKPWGAKWEGFGKNGLSRRGGIFAIVLDLADGFVAGKIFDKFPPARGDLFFPGSDYIGRETLIRRYLQ